MTKRYLYNFLYLLILFLLQAAATKVWAARIYLVPQLALLFLVIFALNNSLPETVWFAFAGGLFLELFSGEFFGAQIFAFTVSGLMVYFTTRYLTSQEISAPTAGILVLGTSALYGLWVFLYHSFGVLLGIAPALAFGQFFAAKLLGTVALNLLLYYPVRAGFRLLPK